MPRGCGRGPASLQEGQGAWALRSSQRGHFQARSWWRTFRPQRPVPTRTHSVGGTRLSSCLRGQSEPLTASPFWKALLTPELPLEAGQAGNGGAALRA